MFISTTKATSVVVGTKAMFFISFYTGQTSAKAEKLSDMNKMVWIYIGDWEVKGLWSKTPSFSSLALILKSKSHSF